MRLENNAALQRIQELEKKNADLVKANAGLQEELQKSSMRDIAYYNACQSDC